MRGKIPNPTTQEKINRAFDFYASLGDDRRSLDLVAKEFGAGLRTVKDWSVQDNWQKRLDQRMQAVEKEAEAKFVRFYARQRFEYLKAIHNKLKRTIEKDEKEQSTYASDKDTFEAVKTVNVMIGKPTEFTQTKQEITGSLEMEPTDTGESLFDIARKCGDETLTELENVFAKITKLRRSRGLD